MMKRCFACVLCIVCLSLPVALYAQEVLTNESIVKMVKAGLNDQLIVQMINTQPGKYRTATDDILLLKKQGASEEVIAAILRKGDAKPSGVGPELSMSGYPTEIGVYWKKEKAWIEMLPEVVNWKTGGVLKSIASAGIVKGDLNGHLNNRQSRNRVATPLEFLIYVPEGVAITEYQLIKLRENKDNREFRTVTGGVLHVKGGATRDLLPFEGKKVASRTFLIALSALSPGEYGFLPPGALTSASSASMGKMYTFSMIE